MLLAVVGVREVIHLLHGLDAVCDCAAQKAAVLDGRERAGVANHLQIVREFQFDDHSALLNAF